jgi:hypothetical protein
MKYIHATTSLCLALSVVAPLTCFAQAAPIPSIPPVTVETKQATAGDLPLISSAAAAESPRESNLSMGTSRASVFFVPLQIRAMEEALTSGESRATASPITQKSADLTVDLSQLQEAPKIVEPDMYPVFYLSSIAYRASNDWSIWVSGHKITSRKNDTNLRILSVSPQSVSFLWSPVFADALITRTREHMFASPEPVKNKLTKTDTHRFDEQSGSVSFSLRTNQSFLPAYMRTFEGFLESPKLPALVAATTTDAAISPEPFASDAPLQQSNIVEKVSANTRSPTDEINLQLKRERKNP